MNPTNNLVLSESNSEEAYDYLIIGTGLVETALGSILSGKNLKVLQIDTNPMYGSEFSTLQYSQLLDHFGEQDDEFEFKKRDKEFNIDLTPKLLLQDSPMKDFLIENNIQDLVFFTSIKGSYLFTDRRHSIPVTEAQALKSSVVGITQKYKVMKFFWNVRKYYENSAEKCNRSMAEEFKKFGLSKESIDFIGHAIALNLDDRYLDEPAEKTYDRIARYVSSIACYEDTESPYLYPIYGLSELCQAFARKAALQGATFMLRAEIKKLDKEGAVLIDPNGEQHRMKAKRIVTNPKYWPDSKVDKEVIRCIAILRKGEEQSRNVIFLKRELNRQNDVFCVILGHTESVCPEELEIAILSTVRETKEKPEKEIEAIVKRLNPIKYFTEARKIYSNEETGSVFFTKNVDESALLDNIYDDIQEICSKLGILEERS